MRAQARGWSRYGGKGRRGICETLAAIAASTLVHTGPVITLRHFAKLLAMARASSGRGCHARHERLPWVVGSSYNYEGQAWAFNSVTAEPWTTSTRLACSSPACALSPLFLLSPTAYFAGTS